MIPQLRHFNLEKNERMLCNNAIEIRATQTARYVSFIYQTLLITVMKHCFFFTKDIIWRHRSQQTRKWEHL